MASISRRRAGFQAQVRRKGFPTASRLFRTLKDAQIWARQIESALDQGLILHQAEASRYTLGDILERYASEISPSHKGHRNEQICISALRRDPIAQFRMALLSSQILAQWRDRRLQNVSGSTVNRELNLISAAINVARKEWGILLVNPVPLIRRPSHNRPRTRRLEGDEERRLLAALSAAPRAINGQFSPTCTNHWIRPLVILAIETGMRQGELLNLKWIHIDLNSGLMFLPETKNGESRTVPLSTTARDLLRSLPRSIDGRVFPVSKNAVLQAFVRACRRGGINDLRFHDLRHEAISRFFERGLSVMEVASISGHKTLSMLKRYTHLSAKKLVMKLA
jgi:integrase